MEILKCVQMESPPATSAAPTNAKLAKGKKEEAPKASISPEPDHVLLLLDEDLSGLPIETFVSHNFGATSVSRDFGKLLQINKDTCVP